MTQLIRLATSRDAAAVADIYRPAVVGSAISFEVEPPDAAEMGRRIEATLQRTPWLVCERDGAVIGYAYAGRHRERAAYQWSVEVSAYVHADARRAGVARRLYEKLFEILTQQGFRNALAGITIPNDASVSFHRSMGFTDVGIFPRIGFKLGRWHDTMWLSRPLRVSDDVPPEPTPLPDLT